MNKNCIKCSKWYIDSRGLAICDHSCEYKIKEWLKEAQISGLARLSLYKHLMGIKNVIS